MRLGHDDDRPDYQKRYTECGHMEIVRLDAARLAASYSLRATSASGGRERGTRRLGFEQLPGDPRTAERDCDQRQDSKPERDPSPDDVWR